MRENNMYTRYYDSYPTQMPEVTAEPVAEEENTDIAEVPEDEAGEIASLTPARGFGGLKTDDILLIGLIFIMLSEGSDDFIMPLILGALLLG